MKQLSKVMLPVLALLLCGVVINATTPTPAAATANIPVTVTNIPLPVQGTISVGNTPSVNIANSTLPVTGNVSVANATDNNNQPVPLLVSSGRTRFAGSCEAQSTTGNAQCYAMTAIPQGERLVMQFVSLETLIPNGTVYEAGTGYVLSDGSHGNINVPLSSGVTGPDGYTRQVYAGPVTSYVENGATGCFATTSGAVAVTLRCTITGYLIPAQ